MLARLGTNMAGTVVGLYACVQHPVLLCMPVSSTCRCDTARAHRSHPSTFLTKPERIEPAQWLTGMQGGLNAWMTQQKNSAEHRNRL